MLAAVQGIEDIALTTNGPLLAARARALAKAGLDRVTVSLDTLDEEAFQAMSDSRSRSRGCWRASPRRARPA